MITLVTQTSNFIVATLINIIIQFNYSTRLKTFLKTDPLSAKLSMKRAAYLSYY